ncbi:MAG: error-prone DNA polymerase [Chloroflexota bacterium]|nr:error-prone DNA polymerase [Chloroflexota bacterium]
MSAYTELHLHTAFSFLDGASQADELIGRAVDLGMDALAVTDHNGLYGAMEFAQLANDAGVRPITGAEVTLLDGSHITLLAETPTGYANLCKLLTEAHRLRDPNPPSGRLAIPFPLRTVGVSRPAQRSAAPDPRLLPEMLAEFRDGLILLTGCRKGLISTAIDAGQFKEAEAFLRQLVAWMGPDQVFVELQHNLVHGDTRRIRHLVQLANHVGVPYVATGNVHYHAPERHRLNDVMVAIHHTMTLDACHRERRPNDQFYLRSATEMGERFGGYPEAIANTRLISDRCAAFNLGRDLDYRFPDYPTGSDQTPDDVLREVCITAIAQRYRPDEIPEAERRLEDELRIITNHKLAGFFLLYRDLLEMAREVALEVRGDGPGRKFANLPPGRGRGSSVSSIVCYLIGLSHVDPIRHNLLFGRFLNDELHSIPDIDLDFPREIREILIERVYERYGHDRAALVCAFSTYKLRSAVRDIGKTLGIPLTDLDKIAKMSDRHGVERLADELGHMPEYAGRIDTPPWSHLIDLASQLAHFPRHVTQHVGGMVISSTPLNELVPIQPAAMEGRFLCHWDKDSCDDARMVKIDFLALGMLSLVEEALDLIVYNGKEPVDLSRIPFDDPNIYDMICIGDTIGTFQIESRAQIQMLPRTQPRRLEDLIVEVAIVRPGPIVGGAVKPYVAHRQRARTSFLPIEPQYDHPILEPVLAETHGVILYQEQVIEVAMALAGFTAGQADSLRRSMTRKRSRDAMISLWTQFRDGAVGKGISPEVARTVFRKLLGFASYGFPKAHAAAFAILAYQSCWLKYYYPTEFLCALLNNQPMGFYPSHVLVNDAKRHGVRVFSPDINLSGVRCDVEDRNGIRIGLAYVKSLSGEAARRIVLERADNGPYKSLADFIRRCPIHPDALQNLIAVGSFDRFGLGRREALWQVGLFISSKRFGVGKGTPEDEKGRQMALPLAVEQDMVQLRPMGAWEQMEADYAVLGLSPRYHPLGLLRSRLPRSYVTALDVEMLPNGQQIQIAGLIVCRQRPGTAKGVQFLLLEDEVGLVNVVVHPALYEQRKMTVRGEPFLVITGQLQHQGGAINIVASDIVPLEEARRHYSEIAGDKARMPAARELIDTPQEESTAAMQPHSHNYY